MTGLKLLVCTDVPQVIPPLKGEGRRALSRLGGVPTRPLAAARVHPPPLRVGGMERVAPLRSLRGANP
jgi:hypothetical protein